MRLLGAAARHGADDDKLDVTMEPPVELLRTASATRCHPRAHARSAYTTLQDRGWCSARDLFPP